MSDPEHHLFVHFLTSNYVSQHLSLLRCLRGPRRQQILLPPQPACSKIDGWQPLLGMFLFLFDPFLSFLLSFLPCRPCLTLFQPFSLQFLVLLNSKFDVRAFKIHCFTRGKPTSVKLVFLMFTFFPTYLGRPFASISPLQDAPGGSLGRF